MLKWMIVAISISIGAVAYASDKPDTKTNKAPAAGPPPPTLTPEGKRWVEGMLGKWTAKEASMQMGDQKMTGKMTMSCEKASTGWASICKGKFESKGMPTQELTLLLGWDLPEGTAHMFEVANTGETHDHAGKWTDDKTITLVRSGKNVEGKEEVDSVTFNWISPKELAVSGDGKVGGAVAWTFSAPIKK